MESTETGLRQHHLQRRIEQLQAELEVSRKTPARFALLTYSLGAALEDEMRRSDKAAEYYLQSFQADPTFLPSATSLLRLYETRIFDLSTLTSPEAETTLDSLTRLFEAVIRTVADPEMRSEALLERTIIAIRAGGVSKPALSYVREATKLLGTGRHPTKSTTSWLLEYLARQLGDYEGVVEALMLRSETEIGHSANAFFALERAYATRSTEELTEAFQTAKIEFRMSPYAHRIATRFCQLSQRFGDLALQEECGRELVRLLTEPKANQSRSKIHDYFSPYDDDDRDRLIVGAAFHQGVAAYRLGSYGMANQAFALAADKQENHLALLYLASMVGNRTQQSERAFTACRKVLNATKLADNSKKSTLAAALAKRLASFALFLDDKERCQQAYELLSLHCEQNDVLGEAYSEHVLLAAGNFGALWDRMRARAGSLKGAERDEVLWRGATYVAVAATQHKSGVKALHKTACSALMSVVTQSIEPEVIWDCVAHAIRLRSLETALQGLRKLINTGDAQTDRAATWLGTVLASSGDESMKRDWSHRAQAVPASSGWVITRELLTALEEDAPQQAATHYKALSEIGSDLSLKGDYLTLAAREYCLVEEYRRAEQVLKTALNLNAQNTYAAAMMREVLFKLDRANETLSLSGGESSQLLSTAFSSEISGNLDTAKEAYQQLLTSKSVPRSAALAAKRFFLVHEDMALYERALDRLAIERRKVMRHVTCYHKQQSESLLMSIGRPRMRCSNNY